MHYSLLHLSEIDGYISKTLCQDRGYSSIKKIKIVVGGRIITQKLIQSVHIGDRNNKIFKFIAS